MSSSKSQQLISDWVDGQLTPDQIERAQQLVAEDAELAALHESLRSQQSMLRSLPKHTLDDSFADQVVTLALSKGLIQEPSQTDRPSSTASISASPNSRWWPPIAAIAALAALILVTLFIVPNLELDRRSASVDSTTAKEIEAELTSDSGSAGDDDEAKQELSPLLEKSKKSAGSMDDAITGGGEQPSFDQKGQVEADGMEADHLQESALAQNQDSNAFKGQPEKVDRVGQPQAASPSFGGSGFGGGGGGKAMRIAKDNRDKIRQKKLEGTSSQPAKSIPPTAQLDPPSQRNRSGRTSESVNKEVLPRIASTKQGLLDGKAMGGGQIGQFGSQPGSGNNLGNQVLVFNVSEDEDTLRLINETFAENGIQVKLPETLTERSLRGTRALHDSDLQAQSAATRAAKREFAFAVRSTPKQMNRAVVTISDQAEIIGIAPQSALQSPVRQQRQFSLTTPDPTDRDNLPVPTETNEQAEQRPAETGVANNELDTTNFDRKPGQLVTGNEKKPSADENQNSLEFQHAETERLVREINEFFGLAPDEETQLAERGYTLIFMLKETAHAVPAVGSDASELPSEPANDAGSDK